MGESRLTMCETMVGTVFRHRFAVTVPAGLASSVQVRLPLATWGPPAGDVSGTADTAQAWRLQFRPGAGWQAQHDSQPLTRAERLEDAFERLMRDVESWIAKLADDLLFVHAGVVGWQGRAILLPGQRLAGRTTLVAALVRAGAVYFSDAYALLDDDGLVHPYPRPLSLHPPGPGVRAAGGVGRDFPALPVGLVARVAYHPAGWRVEPLTRGQAALAIISAGACGPGRTSRLGAVARTAVHGATAISGSRGEARDAVPRLLRASATGMVEGGPRMGSLTVDLRSPPEESGRLATPLAVENGVYD